MILDELNLAPTEVLEALNRVCLTQLTLHLMHCASTWCTMLFCVVHCTPGTIYCSVWYAVLLVPCTAQCGTLHFWHHVLVCGSYMHGSYDTICYPGWYIPLGIGRQSGAVHHRDTIPCESTSSFQSVWDSEPTRSIWRQKGGLCQNSTFYHHCRRQF